MPNNIAKEKPVTSDHCAYCVHKEVCRHKEDYFGFVNAIDEFSERCFGDKICEDVASVKVSCNYYMSPNVVPDKPEYVYRNKEDKNDMR